MVNFFLFFDDPGGAVAEFAAGEVENALQTGAEPLRFLAARGIGGKEAEKRFDEGVAEEFEQVGKNDGAVELSALSGGAVAREPEEAAPPPEIKHVGLAAGEGGGDFVPDMGFRDHRRTRQGY